MKEIKVKTQKEIDELIEILRKNKQNLINLYFTLTGDNINKIESIEVHEIGKIIKDNVITYYLGIGFFGDDDFIIIRNAEFNLNNKTNHITFNRESINFMQAINMG